MSTVGAMAMALHGPFVGENPLTWKARLTLLAMANDHETFPELLKATGLPEIELYEAIEELAKNGFVMFAFGRAFYRIGHRWTTLRGENLTDVA